MARMTRPGRATVLALLLGVAARAAGQEAAGDAVPLDVLTVELIFAEGSVTLGTVERVREPLEPYNGVAESNPLYYQVIDQGGSAIAKGPLSDPRAIYDLPPESAPKTGKLRLRIPAEGARTLTIIEHDPANPATRKVLLEGSLP